jgi:hypothetical protein
MQDSVKRMKREFLLRCAPILAMALFVRSPVCAQIIVDDFTETGGAVFPVRAEHPAFAYHNAQMEIDGVFAGARDFSAFFGNLSPIPDPPPVDSSVLIDIGSVAGVLEVKAGADSRIGFNIFWHPTQFAAFADLDVTSHPQFEIRYTSNFDLALTISVRNLSRLTFLSSPDTSAGSQFMTVLPAASNGQFRVDIADIVDPLGWTTVPSVDFASLDSIGIRLQSNQLGANLLLSRVAFVPEPSTIGLLLLSTIFLVLSPRRTPHGA